MHIKTAQMTTADTKPALKGLVGVWDEPALDDWELRGTLLLEEGGRSPDKKAFASRLPVWVDGGKVD